MAPSNTNGNTTTTSTTSVVVVVAVTTLVTAAASIVTAFSLIDSWRSRRQVQQLTLELRQSQNRSQQQQQQQQQQQHRKKQPIKTAKSAVNNNKRGVHNEQNKKNEANLMAFRDGCNVLPIGYVESCYHDIAVTPRQPGLVPSAKAIIILDKSVSPTTLKGLDEHSHVWIVFLFHKNNNPTKTLGSSGQQTKQQQQQLRHKGYKTKIRVPRNTAAKGSSTANNNNNTNDNCKVGCLATRTPHRPNPVGLSLGTIENVCLPSRQITLSGSDLLDGTPVIDIKPYVPVYDNPEILQQRKYNNESSLDSQDDNNSNRNSNSRRRNNDEENDDNNQVSSTNTTLSSSSDASSSTPVVRVPYFSDPKSFTRRNVTFADGLEEQFLKMSSEKGGGSGTSLIRRVGFKVFRHDPPSRVLDALVQTLQVDVSRRPNQTKPLKPYILHFDGLSIEYVVSTTSQQKPTTNEITPNEDEHGDDDGSGNELPYDTHIWSVKVLK